MLKDEFLIHYKQLYNCKWYHYIYYWFYNRWQKYIKKSNKWIGCCRGDASRPLKANYTVELVNDIDAMSVDINGQHTGNIDAMSVSTKR